LEEPLIGNMFDQYTFLDLIELIDVRVYKTKGTDPRADISRFAYQLNSSWSVQQIQNWLLWYNRYRMSRETFLSYLRGDIYGNRALPLIFIDYSEYLRKREYSLDELMQLSKTTPTIEHIVASSPKFSPPAFGFNNLEEFIEYEHKLGNLTVLEEKFNKAVQNKNPKEKVPSYDRSAFKITKTLSSKIAKKKQFTKSDIQERTEDLSAFCVDRWWC
jgi:hypothetical protein